MSTPPVALDLPPLVAAAPFTRLLAALEEEIRVRGRRVTRDGLSLELALLQSVAADIRAAIGDARSMRAIGNVKDASSLIGRPESTVRRICGRAEARAGARRVEGEWSIDLATFVSFYRASRGRGQDAADVGDGLGHAPPADGTHACGARSRTVAAKRKPVTAPARSMRTGGTTPAPGPAPRMSRRARAKLAARVWTESDTP